MDENKKFDCREFYDYQYFEKKFPKFPEAIINKLVDIQKDRIQFIFDKKNKDDQNNQEISNFKDGKFVLNFD